MGLALQVKKFINSEHTGLYAEITLPGMPEVKDGENVPETAKIHYFEAGAGEPLILLHSVGQSAYTWRNVFERLSQFYRVFAIDLLGHGYSSRPISFDYSIDQFSLMLELFMKAVGLESSHLLAFSMGGLYALDFIRKYPKRVGKSILISPGSITEAMPLAVRMMTSPLLGGVASRLYGVKTVRALLESSLFDLTAIDEMAVGEYYKTVSDPDSRRAILDCIRNCDDESMVADLREIYKDILIVWGTEDKIRPPEEADLFHSALPNSQFALIRNAGHLVQEEKPDRIIDVTLEYIPVLLD